jgi:hypothetical protein
MNRALPLIVAMLVAVDIYTLSVMQAWRSRPQPPDLTPRVAQLEKDLSQAQADIGDLKQQMLLVERRGQPPD